MAVVFSSRSPSGRQYIAMLNKERCTIARANCMKKLFYKYSTQTGNLLKLTITGDTQGL